MFVDASIELIGPLRYFGAPGRRLWAIGAFVGSRAVRRPTLYFR
jgi:hypothetical protein